MHFTVARSQANPGSYRVELWKSAWRSRFAGIASGPESDRQFAIGNCRGPTPSLPGESILVLRIKIKRGSTGLRPQGTPIDTISNLTGLVLVSLGVGPRAAGEGLRRVEVNGGPVAATVL